MSSSCIKEKNPIAFLEMCRIAKINPELVEANDDNAGGAQALLKNVSQKFLGADPPFVTYAVGVAGLLRSAR